MPFSKSVGRLTLNFMTLTVQALIHEFEVFLVCIQHCRLEDVRVHSFPFSDLVSTGASIQDVHCLLLFLCALPHTVQPNSSEALDPC